VSTFWTAIGGISAFLAASAVVVKGVRGSKWALIRAQTRVNLHRMGLDWVGEESRPGFEGRPSFPERMTRDEEVTAAVNHYVRGELTSRISLVAQDVDVIKAQGGETSNAVARLDYRVNGLDQRITSDRERGEREAALLRAELERRASDLEQALAERNKVIDTRLSGLSHDLLRGETYRASLVELGLPIDDAEHRSTA
jgi:hypothetical protein